MGSKESQPGAPQAAAHLIAGSLTRVDRSAGYRLTHRLSDPIPTRALIHRSAFGGERWGGRGLVRRCGDRAARRRM
jgi:hypothetical protein